MTQATQPDLRAKLDEVNEQIDAKRSTAQEKWQAFEDAKEQFVSAGNEANRTDSDEFKKVDTVHKEFSTVAEEVKDLEATRDGIFRMLGLEAPQHPLADDPKRVVSPSEDFKSIAARLEESKGYKDLLESGALKSDRQAFNAKLLETSRNELKALLTGASATSAGAFVQNDVQPYVPQPRRQFRLLDLITIGDTDSDTVEYVRQDSFTNAAAETAEATATDTGTKPEATIAFTVITEAVQNIAHWLPATRRSIADAGQLRTLVESQLLYGLNLRVEGQVANGSGSGGNLKGILNTSNILSQALGSDSVADAIHKAITQIRLADLEPNGVAMHPNDWQILRLSKDNSGSVAGTGNYLFGPPSQVGAQQVWGLDVAVTASVPDDTSIVGDFTKSVLWIREGAEILASDSHDDFFVKNLVAVLAEMRAVHGVLIPAAFCKVTSVD